MYSLVSQAMIITV